MITTSLGMSVCLCDVCNHLQGAATIPTDIDIFDGIGLNLLNHIPVDERLKLIGTHSLLALTVRVNKMRCFTLLWNDIEKHYSVGLVNDVAFQTVQDTTSTYQISLLAVVAFCSNDLPWKTFVDDTRGIQQVLLDATNHPNRLGQEYPSPLIVACSHLYDERAAWLAGFDKSGKPRLRSEHLNQYGTSGRSPIAYVRCGNLPLTMRSFLDRGIEVDLNAPIIKSKIALPAHFLANSKASEWYTWPEQRWGKFIEGDEVDAMDRIGDWYEATIIAVDFSRVKVHFHGWDDNCDEWIPLNTEIGKPIRLASFHTHYPSVRYTTKLPRPVLVEFHQKAHLQRTVISEKIGNLMKESLLVPVGCFPKDILRICFSYLRICL